MILWKPDTASITAIQRFGNYLLQMQTSDGALPLGLPGTSDSVRVVPYFGNFGAWGLAVAYRVSGNPLYLAGVRKWIEWNDARRNPDGTVYDYQGKPGAWISTKEYDSTDSYGSTYLELLNLLESLKLPDAERRWLRTRLPFARQALDAMLLTQQKNGLTTAKPTWPVMYTMDNTEVLRGLLAGALFFQSETGRDPGSAARCSAQAKRVTASIARDLWDAGNDCYLVGLQTDGGRMAGLQKWYPDIMANLMALGWLPSGAEGEPRHRLLYARLVKQFGDSSEMGVPATLATEGDLERLIWWGFAAKCQQDRGRATRACTLLQTFDPIARRTTNPATLGHVCRLLASEPEK